MQKRVKIDFKIDFIKGGGLQGCGFQLEVSDNNMSDEKLSEYITNYLHVQKVQRIKIIKKEIIGELIK